MSELSRDQLETAGVPPRMLDCRYSNWRGDPPSLAGDIVLIHGPAGTGKTHLAVAELAAAGIRPGAWGKRDESGFLVGRDEIEVGSFYTDVQVAVEKMKPNVDSRMIEFCMKAQLLVFDDLGAERLTDFTLDRISLVLRHRYDHLLRTILTTNLSPTELSQIDPRLASRLLSGTVIPRKGSDQRLVETPPLQ